MLRYVELLLLARRTSCMSLSYERAQEASHRSHCCFNTMTWRVWSVLFFMFNNLCSILLFTISSRAVPSLRYQFVEFLWVSGSDAAGPTDGDKADYTLEHRLHSYILVNKFMALSSIRSTACSVPSWKQSQCYISSPVYCPGKLLGICILELPILPGNIPAVHIPPIN